MQGEVRKWLEMVGGRRGKSVQWIARERVPGEAQRVHSRVDKAPKQASTAGFSSGRLHEVGGFWGREGGAGGGVCAAAQELSVAGTSGWYHRIRAP